MTSSCPDESVFIELLQGELSREDRRHLDAHIDTCTLCSEMVAELALIMGDMSELAPTPLRGHPAPPIVTAPPASDDPLTAPPPTLQPQAPPATRPRRHVAGAQGQRIGDFKLLRPLGKGGMGVVFLAEHDQTGQRVALKTLSAIEPNLLESLRQEIRALRRLNHPSIVRVLEDGVHQGIPWVAMALISGQTMRQHLRLTGPSHPHADHSTAALTAPQTTDLSLLPAHLKRSIQPKTAPAPSATAFSQPWTSSLNRVDLFGASPQVAPEPPQTSQPQPGVTPTASVQSTTDTDNTATTLDAPLTPTQLATLRWFAQLSHALAFLHGEGMVHCDLKPSNLLLGRVADLAATTRGVTSPNAKASQVARGARENIAPEPQAAALASSQRGAGRWATSTQTRMWAGEAPRRAVLVDFGLAARLGQRVAAETLANAGRWGGTALYMCPERIEGRQFDARADLYALGCMMYEAFAGRPPFLSDTTDAILMQHVAMDPVSLTDRGVKVPERLEALIMSLLAKNPQDRPGHAQIVLEALRGLGVTPDFDVTPPAPRPYLYMSPLVGREQLIDVLQQAHDEVAEARRGQCVVLTGESGVGKTRLAAEIVKAAREAKNKVLIGQCNSADGRQPLHAFRAILRTIEDHCRAGGLERTETVLGKRGPLLAPFSPSIRRLPGQAAKPAPAPLPPEHALARLVEALTATIDVYCEGRPLLLVIDDLQWTDQTSLACLKHLHRHSAQAGRPWLILGTERTEDSPAAVRDALRTGDIVCHQVSRLEQPAAQEMIATMLGLKRPPLALTEFIVDQANGNAFFVAAYLQMTLDNGLLTMDERGRWRLTDEDGDPDAKLEDAMARLPAPGSITALVSGRLERLDAPTWRSCAAAAILGRSFKDEHLRAMTGLPMAHHDETLIELKRRQIIEADSSGELRFIHDKLRESTLERLDADELQGWHHRAARYLSTQEDAEPARLGWHWKHAGYDEPAREAFVLAANSAVERFALDDAGEYYREAIALDDTHPRANTLRLDLIEQVLHPRGQFDLTQQIAQRVIQDTRDLDDRSDHVRAVKCLGVAYEFNGDLNKAARLLRQAVEGYRTLNDRRGEGTALNALVVALTIQGKHEEALKVARQVLALQQALGDKKATGIALNDMALLLIDLRQYKEAISHLERAGELFNETGHRFGEGTVFNNLSLCLEQLGKPKRQLAALRKALEICEEVGHRQGANVIRHNIASNRLMAGDFEGLELQWMKIIEDYKVMNFKLGEASAKARLGILLRLRGDLDQAMKATLAARDIFEEIGAYQRLARIHIDLCLNHVALDEHAQAAQALEKVEALLVESPSALFSAQAMMIRTKQSLRHGHLQKTLEQTRHTQDLLKEHSDDATRRQSFHLHLFRSKLARYGLIPQPSFSHLELAALSINPHDPQYYRAIYACEAGHVALADATRHQAELSHEGDNAVSHAQVLLNKAIEIHNPFQFGPRSDIARNIKKLEAAIEAHLAGQALIAGEHPDHIPVELRRALTGTQPR